MPEQNCPDGHCNAQPGQPHHAECEVAVCQRTGTQRLLHLMPVDTLTALIGDLPQSAPGGHDCGSDVWTGERHGVAECREFGWWARMAGAGDAPLTGWIPCPPGTPGAVLDLNQLHLNAVWSEADQRWYRLDAMLAGGGA